MIQVKLSHGAQLPKQNNPTDSGFDVIAKGYMKNGKTYWFDDEGQIGAITLYPNERILIKTGVQMSLSKDMPTVGYKSGLTGKYVMEVQVRSRSGLTLKNGIHVLNGIGTIDNGYINDIGVILHNASNESFDIHDGDRIAQISFNYVFIPDPESFEIVDELDISDRGMNGFGSSGTK